MILRRLLGTLWISSVFVPILLAGCSGLWPRWFDTVEPPPDPPVVILVAPVVVEAPIGDASDIYTFTEPPSDDLEPQVRAQLIDELALRAQRVLTEQVTTRPGFRVVHFAEARRLGGGVREVGQRWTDEELATLGSAAGADLVIAARINDYGRLGWRHWVYGWLVVASTHTVIVGAATGWNPLAMGGYLAYDLATDLPLWYGGAYILGWAFRPVHIEVEGLQLTGCVQRVWYDQEVTILASRSELAKFAENQRPRKDIQLQVNLDRALSTLAEVAGNNLRLKPCRTD